VVMGTQAVSPYQLIMSGVFIVVGSCGDHIWVVFIVVGSCGDHIWGVFIVVGSCGDGHLTVSP